MEAPRTGRSHPVAGSVEALADTQRFVDILSVVGMLRRCREAAREVCQFFLQTTLEVLVCYRFDFL